MLSSQTKSKPMSDEIAAINAQQAEATEIRNADKAKNEEAIADPKVAQEAVEKAMKVIQEFYDKTGGAICAAPAQPRRGDERRIQGSLQGHDGWRWQFG